MTDISVIIPCHNLEPYIERCLNSILRQDYDKEKYEILVIFDSCTDRTEEIVKRILENSESNYKMYNANVKRAGLARNIGLENAAGKYIYFIDGDDYLIDDSALTEMLRTSEITGYPVVYQERFESDCKVVDEEAIWRYFYQSEIIGETRFSSKELNEDWEFVRKIKEKADYRETGIKKALYHYTYPRKDSITDQYRSMMKREV